MAQSSSALDSRRWHALWHRLGAQGSSAPSFDLLQKAYTEPGRYYHSAEHIRDCLEQLDRGRHLARQPDEIEAALWFHDAIYRPGDSNNEEESASLASQLLTSAGARDETVSRVADLVMATRHDTLPTDSDAQLLCDIDLSILGREPDRFARYEQQIRREYAWVPEPLYRKKRAEVLAGFLARPAVYQTEFFRERYELAAKSNLTRIIRELQAS
jgi:predicted metal-dependent HD superfamily phosphohydrolase